MSEDDRRLDVNWVQATAGALAATSSAVLLSTVGVTGTIIGAALGSVAATVGHALYSRALLVSRERVAAAARVAARERAIRARHPRPTRARPDRRPDPEPDPEPEPDPKPQRSSSFGGFGSVNWRELLGQLRWKRVATVSVALFVGAMALIVSFELAAGASVGTLLGGTDGDGRRTSVPGFGGSSREGQPPPESTPPDGTPTEASTPGGETATTEPTTTATTTEPPSTEPPETTPPEETGDPAESPTP